MSSDASVPDERYTVECTVNGEDVSARIPPNRTLVEMLREDLNLTGTTEGCGVGICGCCTVLVDGRTVSSCFELAVNVDDTEIWTVEGLEDLHAGDGLHPLQEAFQDCEGFQCGYCTPGMLMSSYTLLQDHPDPSDEEIGAYLSENLCRCTGYEDIVTSVKRAVEDVDLD